MRLRLLGICVDSVSRRVNNYSRDQHNGGLFTVPFLLISNMLEDTCFTFSVG